MTGLPSYGMNLVSQLKRKDPLVKAQHREQQTYSIAAIVRVGNILSLWTLIWIVQCKGVDSNYAVVLVRKKARGIVGVYNSRA